MLLLASPNIDVVGITCVNGNVSVAQVSHNVRRILSTCGREDVPIYVGAEAPLVERRRDASYFHGKVQCLLSVSFSFSVLIKLTST